MSKARPSYEVIATRSGKWWALSVPSVPGAFSQCKRLDQAEAQIRDALSLGLDVPESSFDVVITANVDDDLQNLVDAAGVARRLASEAREQSVERVRAAVDAAAARGLSARDSAELLGVSFQYVARLRS